MFKRIYSVDTSLVWVTKKKKRESEKENQIAKIMDEKQDITTEFTDIEKLLWDELLWTVCQQIR